MAMKLVLMVLQLLLLNQKVSIHRIYFTQLPYSLLCSNCTPANVTYSTVTLFKALYNGAKVILNYEIPEVTYSYHQL